MSNPANRLPPEYDETLPKDYDPEFTSDISTKMRIPEKIGANEDIYNDYGRYAADELKKVASMNVPDRIMIYGNEGNGEMPDLHLDLNSMPTSTYVGLDTPPRVLTLEDRPFPNPGESQHMNQPQFDDEEDVIHVDKNSHNVSFNGQNGYVPQTPPRHPGDPGQQDMLPVTPGEGLLIQHEGEDDLAQLKRQMAKLHRQVQHIQEENGKRSQREYVLYPVMLGYVLFQMVKWFMQQH